jgi:hypothetical protein
VKQTVDIVPISQKAAKRWVNETHRHLDAPQGDLFRTCLKVDGQLQAVAIAGRPCRCLQDGRTAEILRIASIAAVEVNACTRLYSALIQAARYLGYRRFVTYTLLGEPGTSLRAFGFEFDGFTDGGEWDRPSRKRKTVVDSSPKRRWIFPKRDSGLWDDLVPGRKEVA